MSISGFVTDISAISDMIYAASTDLKETYFGFFDGMACSKTVSQTMAFSEGIVAAKIDGHEKFKGYVIGGAMRDMQRVDVILKITSDPTLTTTEVLHYESNVFSANTRAEQFLLSQMDAVHVI